jgi:anion-transporting  ArsA/GET3 family ATPase
MKKQLYSGMTIMVIAIFAVGIIAAGCKSKKNVTQAAPANEVLVEQYCSGPDYFSNNEFFRSNDVGESMDQSTSKKKAMSNAKAALAGYIETTLKAAFDNYVNSRELNNVEEVKERYEGLSREVVNQKLNGIRLICEKQTRTSDNRYKTYVAIELTGDDIVSMMNQRLSDDDKLKIDYDYEKFKQTFNDEMDKMEKERGL